IIIAKKQPAKPAPGPEPKTGTETKPGSERKPEIIVLSKHETTAQTSPTTQKDSESEIQPGEEKISLPNHTVPTGNGTGAISNIISKDNTAWNIAGEYYDDSTSLYILTDNRVIRGDRLGDIIGWDRIPTGTRVLVNQPLDREEKKGPVFLITKEYTAWSLAGRNYRKASTIYFLPGGKIVRGNRFADWDS
ncbi:MAG: hypothetical protein GY950_01475, partial [bacterium]|nr:hypothetical protein [bacterium]